MKFLRFSKDKVEMKGIYEDGKIRRIFGSFFDNYTVSDEIYDEEEVTFLPPVIPSKFVCVGRNYAEHAKELGNEVPTEPLIFLKPSTAANAHKGDILYPPMSNKVDHEAELAVVIGKRCSQVSEKDAMKYVFGYTCLNDITARDIQKKENKFTRAKSFDTFAPFGPFIETEFDYENVGIRCRVNGEIRQDGNTKDMIFKIPYLISFISNVMTLLPGDVIATGTPSGVGGLNIGDTVEVEIDGIGKLVNYVKARN